MPRNIAARAKQQYDVAVIGGGSNGTAIARDAAMRGLTVALLEKEDFGYGTVSRSTRLIHGGLRYLELFDFGLVRESLREREILLRTAPHLVHPLKFFTPVYENSPVGLTKLKLGMWLYDLLSWDKTLPRHKLLSPSETQAAKPLLTTTGLRGTFVYYDGHVPMPERLCLEAAQQAARRGAFIANYCKAVSLRRGGDAYVLGVRDQLTGHNFQLRTRAVVNATGPWADGVNKTLFAAKDERLRHTKGIHLLVPKLGDYAVVMLAERDGRLFFAVPWGDYTYIGTTDTDFDGDLDATSATSAEIEYLLEETRRVFPGADLRTVHFTTAGVRPLVRARRARSEGKVSRKHLIVHHAAEGLRGFFSVLGGKITNMRSVAEETVDRVIRHLDIRAEPCTTRHTLFPGAMHPNMDDLKSDLIKRYGALGIGADVCVNLVQLYGSNAEQVLELAAADGALAERVVADGPDIWAQLTYGIRHEWIHTTSDFLLRRTAIGLRPGMATGAAPEVARRLGAAYGRSDEQMNDDVTAYERTVERMAGGVEPLHARTS